MATEIVTCAESGCPLRSTSPRPKFCPECGAAASTKVVLKNLCACGYDLGDTAPNFCPECGRRHAAPPPVPGPVPTSVRDEEGEKPYGSLGALLEAHETRRAMAGLPGGGSARGLTTEEQQRLERNLRQQADRRYTDPSVEGDPNAYTDVSRFETPDEETVRRAGVTSRIAEHVPDGQHKPGGLSARGSTVEPGYWNDVRVIPHSFRNPARRGRELIGPQTKVDEETGELSNDEKGFYHRELDDDPLVGALGSLFETAKTDDEPPPGPPRKRL